jgi:hypothetical protein
MKEITPMNRSADALTRRGLITSAAGAGAVAAAAQLLPSVRVASTDSQPAPATQGRSGGYRLTEHVKRYYRTTLV